MVTEYETRNGTRHYVTEQGTMYEGMHDTFVVVVSGQGHSLTTLTGADCAKTSISVSPNTTPLLLLVKNRNQSLSRGVFVGCLYTATPLMGCCSTENAACGVE
jgi:hypothetical protein